MNADAQPNHRQSGLTVHALELELLLTAIARRYGYDFRHYAPASLFRRVRRAMQEERVQTISGLQERLLHDPGAMRRFVSVLSVHVTSMFRDPPLYRLLRSQVIPVLRTYPFVRIWHAGCATGEEAYSVAILLDEEGLYDRCRIYATDISDDLLTRAKAGVFSLGQMRDFTANYIQSGGTRDFSGYYTADSQHAVLKKELQRNIVFSQHNLATDRCFNEFQLVLCRNVMIYFDHELRRHVHRLLYDSLGRFGILTLGTRESIRFSEYEDRYEVLNEKLRLYRRIR